MLRTHHDKLTSDGERQLAETILGLEDALRAMLDAVPGCGVRTSADTASVQRTRNDTVDDLGAAVKVARAAKPRPDNLARIVATWSEAESLRWRLALSAEHIARGEARRYASARVSSEDLHQEGILGLLAAAIRFEPGRGVRFGVYARWWVRAKLVALVRVAEVLRLSSSANELYRNAQKLRLLDQHEGRERPVSALAAELGVAPQRLRDVMAAAGSRPEEGNEDRDVHAIVASLPDLALASPEQTAVDNSVARRLRSVIDAGFNERERHILNQRYAEPGASVAAIAQTLSLSVERVRQLEQQCLSTLRAVFQREMDV